MHSKNLHVTVEKSSSPEFDAKFVLSASSPDRVGDTIDPAAYKAVAARIKKLVALWQHDSAQPVGFWTNLKADGERLVADLKLASTNLGNMVKQLLADEVPLAASIGFRGEGEPRKDAKGNFLGIHFTKLDLLETSIVSVPAHPKAQQIAKQFGVTLTSDNTDPSPAGSSVEQREQVAKRAVAALHTSLNTIHQDRKNEAL